MYYVYLLKLKDSSIYTGSTPDLKRRLTQHNNGHAESTRNFRPLRLVWFCGFPNRLEARRFETYLKTGSGQAFRNKRFLSS
ncbi:MAG: GIY-YIG nuclease family protein [Candidatus Wildermuthbacteria bacterium]|nr:GIY-YIG nuclease family protein [Candidatus Wildermuthbacteria bacterium]